MKVTNRRNEITNLLLSSGKPVSGSELSKTFGVSRQIIVQDIAFLKSEGFDIISTHTGYLIKEAPLAEKVFKLCHTTEQTEDELASIVALGGTVADVFVWHKVYGKVTAKLNISTKQDVKEFINGVRSGKSTELMNITGGYHYHTVRAASEEILENIEQTLKEKNYIAPII